MLMGMLLATVAWQCVVLGCTDDGYVSALIFPSHFPFIKLTINA